MWPAGRTSNFGMEPIEESETAAVVELRRLFRAALAAHLSDITALTEVIGVSQLATKGLLEERTGRVVRWWKRETHCWRQ